MGMKRLRTLRAKVLATSLILYLLLLLSFLVVYEISLSNIRNITVQLMEASIEKDRLQLDGMIENVEKVADLIGNETEIQNALRNPLPENETDMYRQRLTFNQKIYNLQKYMSQIDSVYVLGENGAIFRSSIKTLQSQSYVETDWYRKVVDAKTALWVDPNQPSLLIKNLDRPTLSYIFPIRDKISFNVLGVVVVEILSTELDSYFTETFLKEGGVFIQNGEGNITYDNNQLALASYLESSRSQSGNDFTTKASLAIPEWSIVAHIPEAVVFSTLYEVRFSILLVFGVVSLAALLWGWLSARRMTRPIQKMKDSMKRVEKGDFEGVLAIDSQDELGELTRSFNHMLTQIEDLIQEKSRQQKLLEIAELKALQSQINPHFLYNTLDSINWMARLNQLDAVSEMVEALTRIFRVSLSRGAIMIPLRDELTHVTEYMKIQKHRYGDRIDFQVEVPKEFYEYQIVKIVLQPLVENALYHGLRDLNQKGSIRITAREEEEKLIFSITDTGIGFSPERLKEIRELLALGADTSSKSYGVINVQRRLQVYFGQDFGLSYSSTPGEGTTVDLAIPKQRGENNV